MSADRFKNRQLYTMGFMILCLILPVFLLAQEKTPEFNTLFGTTGALNTPSAYTLAKSEGRVGIFENLVIDEYDVLIFDYGIAERVEIGIQSDVPSKPDSKVWFFFKVQANEQGKLLGAESKFIPALAFGMNKNGTFAVVSYRFSSLCISIGYNFSKPEWPVFGHVNIQLLKTIALQLEYINNMITGAIRCRYKHMIFSLIYNHDITQQAFNSENTFVEITYVF